MIEVNPNYFFSFPLLFLIQAIYHYVLCKKGCIKEPRAPSFSLHMEQL